jgi:hypothetical protein
MWVLLLQQPTNKIGDEFSLSFHHPRVLLDIGDALLQDTHHHPIAYHQTHLLRNARSYYCPTFSPHLDEEPSLGKAERVL